MFVCAFIGLNKPDFTLNVSQQFYNDQWPLNWICFRFFPIYWNPERGYIFRHIHLHTITLMYILLLHSMLWNNHLTSIFWPLYFSMLYHIIAKMETIEKHSEYILVYSTYNDSKNQFLYIRKICTQAVVSNSTILQTSQPSMEVSLPVHCVRIFFPNSLSEAPPLKKIIILNTLHCFSF